MVISKVYVHAPAGMDYHKNTKSEKKKEFCSGLLQLYKEPWSSTQ